MATSDIMTLAKDCSHVFIQPPTLVKRLKKLLTFNLVAVDMIPFVV